MVHYYRGVGQPLARRKPQGQEKISQLTARRKNPKGRKQTAMKRRRKSPSEKQCFPMVKMKRKHTKKSRVVSDAEDFDSDLPSCRRKKAIAPDGEEEAGKELSDKKAKERIYSEVTASQAMKKRISLQIYLENQVMKRKKNSQVLTKTIWKKKGVKLRQKRLKSQILMTTSREESTWTSCQIWK